MVLRVKRLVLNVKWMNCDTFRKVNGIFTRKTKYYYILMYCFTRKPLVGANRVRIHLLSVKQIVLRVKPIVLRVKQKYHYILMYCFTRKVNCFTRKDKYFTRKTLDK